MMKKAIFILLLALAFVLPSKVGAAAESTLSFSPSDTTPTVGDTFTVNVNINSGTNEVTGVELHLTFDESKIEAQSITEGTFFTNPNTTTPSISNTNGTISYTLLVPPGGTGVTGTGTVAVITFKAIAAGNVSLTFSSQTLVTAAGESGVNVLASSPSKTITVGASTSSTATPTATPTSSPSSTTSGTGGTSTTTTTLPDAGVSFPTLIGAALGLLLLIPSLIFLLK